MPADDRKLTMAELGRVAPWEYADQRLRRIRLVLDDVRSRHNVGSMFRTADAFGIEGLVLCGFTPLPPHREIDKTALGATLSVPWEHQASTIVAIEQLRGQGYFVVAVEQTVGAVELGRFNAPTDRPLALIMGNELRGVSDAAVKEADACITVPQQGSKHSLNISVCTGVVLWQLTSTGAAFSKP
jgi:23S rRNA (guanosine2251-2'-O)-methyltransferase